MQTLPLRRTIPLEFQPCLTTDVSPIFPLPSACVCIYVVMSFKILHPTPPLSLARRWESVPQGRSIGLHSASQ